MSAAISPVPKTRETAKIVKEKSNAAKNARDLRRIIVLGTSIGFGCVVGSLEALRPSHAGFTFQITGRSFVAFAIGAILVFPFWRIIFSPSQSAHQTASRRWAMIFLAILGLASFLYPLRFIPNEKISSLLIGLGAAICALTGVAGLLWMMKRFLDRDARQNENPSGEK